MGKTITVTLTLPDEVVQQFKYMAQEGRQTLETVMVETLMMHQPELKAINRRLAPLADCTDEELWAVVKHTLTAEQERRLDELTDRIKSSLPLAGLEAEEHQKLLDLSMEQMLKRSEALVLLKERGYTVAHFFGQSDD